MRKSRRLTVAVATALLAALTPGAVGQAARAADCADAPWMDRTLSAPRRAGLCSPR